MVARLSRRWSSSTASRPALSTSRSKPLKLLVSASKAKGQHWLLTLRSSFSHSTIAAKGCSSAAWSEEPELEVEEKLLV
jgi:hypothetical protein